MWKTFHDFTVIEFNNKYFCLFGKFAPNKIDNIQ